MNNPLMLILVIAAVIAGLFALIVLMFMIQYFALWLQAMLSGARVGFLELIGMRFRKVDPQTIVLSRIRAVKAGLDLSTNQLETHYLAGGNVPRVVNAMIAADRANIDLPGTRASAIDLAGRDILDAVQTSVNPKVIDCPSPERGQVDDRRGGPGRHSAQSQGPRDGARQPRPAGRRGDRGNDHRPRRRRHRHHHRLGHQPQGGAGKPRPHLQDRAGKGPGRGHGL